ncbi:MAG: hypothetical protein RJA25_2648 [Bacteroidota bacterium]|jgi:hypothetical protein
MALPNIYDSQVAQQLIDRINKLTPETLPLWGKMNASQMLAHCNVTYEYIFDERTDKPNFFVKWMLKKFVKKKVTSEEPYAHNLTTGPAFIIPDTKNYNQEKSRLIHFITKVTTLGTPFFVDKKSVSFDELTMDEWNNMMYKHIDHHLRQFGV